MTDLTHHCHAIGCSTVCPPRHLMCLPHWRMVPLPLAREVWRNYRLWQEIDKQPSKAYLEAAQRAIDAVHEKELKRQARHDARGDLLGDPQGQSQNGNEAGTTGRR